MKGIRTLMYIILTVYILNIVFAIYRVVTSESIDVIASNISGALGWFCAFIMGFIIINVTNILK